LATQTAQTPINWQKYAGWAVSALVILALAFVLINAGSGIRPARIVNAAIQGLLAGGIYALVALGIVLVNKASGVFNFAHGQMLLFGAFVFYSFFSVIEVSWWAAGALAAATCLTVMTVSSWRGLLVPKHWLYGVLATIALTVLMSFGGAEWRFVHSVIGGTVAIVLTGLLIERLAIRPLIEQPLFAIVLMTLALDRLFAGLIQLLWGSIDRSLTIFTLLSDIGIPDVFRFDAENTFLQGQIRISASLLIAFLLALAAFGVFVLFFRFTSVGLAMRATSENQPLARAVGLRVRVILSVAWALTGILAMVAGVLQAGATTLNNTMAFIALRAFPAVLLGGLESIGGAIVGGFAIGIAC
jgi:branched-chain amino acid transport system permease protein